MLASLSEIQPVQTSPHLRIMQTFVAAKDLRPRYLDLNSGHNRRLWRSMVNLAPRTPLLAWLLNPTQFTSGAQ